VRVATLERLLEAHRRTSPRVPSFAEQPAAVIWDQALFAELATSAAATATRERCLPPTSGTSHGAVTTRVIDDLNTPEDYERLIRR